MKSNLVVGYDSGRMYTKLFTIIDGQEIELRGPNAICVGYDRSRIDQEALEKEMKFNLEDLLDVTITQDNESKRYFVGELARKNHRGDLLTSSNQINKFYELTADKERGKLLTYAALAAYKKNKKEIIVRTGTGAPTEEFYDEIGNRELAEFKNNMVESKIKFNHPKFQGYEVKVIPTKMDFAPEGTASTYSARYNINLATLELTEDEWMVSQLQKGMVFISNLGSSSEDDALLRNDGFDGRGSFGLEIGSSVATEPLQSDLESQYGFKKDKTTVDYYLQKAAVTNRPILYRGMNIDINRMAKPLYRNMIERRNQLMFDKLNRNGIDPGDIVAQYQTGGTVEYLKLIGLDRYLKLFPHAEIKISNHPHYDEARGYFIMSLLKLEYEKINASEQYGHKIDIGSSDTDPIEVE